MKARPKPPLTFHPAPPPNGQSSHDSTLPRHSTSDGSLDCVTLQLEPHIALGHGSVIKKVHINMCPILDGYGVMGIF